MHLFTEKCVKVVEPPIFLLKHSLVGMLAHAHTYIYTYFNGSNHKHVHPHANTHIHTRSLGCVRARTNTHTYTHIHTHTHTHAHTHKPGLRSRSRLKWRSRRRLIRRCARHSSDPCACKIIIPPPTCCFSRKNAGGNVCAMVYMCGRAQRLCDVAFPWTPCRMLDGRRWGGSGSSCC